MASKNPAKSSASKRSGDKHSASRKGAKRKRHEIEPAGLSVAGHPVAPGALAGLAAAGAALAGWAFLTHRAARAAEAAHPPTGKFVEADGVRLHYIEAGHGPPIVLLHGNGANAADFALSGLLPRLAETHRVIAFDRPGYGWSERPRGLGAWTAARQARLIGKALDALGIGKTLVLGHSWGTLVALALAVEEPERVSGLALLAGPYFPDPRLDVLLSAPSALPGIGDLLRYTTGPLTSRALLPMIVKRVFAPKPVPTRFRERFPTTMSWRPIQLRATAAETATMLPDAARLARHYKELAMPVAILTGAEDQMVPAHQSERLHAIVTGSRLGVFPGVGHMLHYAVPGAIAEAVRRLGASSV